MTRNHDEIIHTLLRRKSPKKHVKAKASSLAGRFQVFEIVEDAPIRDFVLSQGIEFKKGRGFYQLSKAETIQPYKEIMLVDKITFDIFDDNESRRLLNLPARTGTHSGALDVRFTFKDKQHSGLFQKYHVFIQSTSVNRRLVGGTKFLYEVPDWER